MNHDKTIGFGELVSVTNTHVLIRDRHGIWYYVKAEYVDPACSTVGQSVAFVRDERDVPAYVVPCFSMLQNFLNS